MNSLDLHGFTALLWLKPSEEFTLLVFSNRAEGLISSLTKSEPVSASEEQHNHVNNDETVTGLLGSAPCAMDMVKDRGCSVTICCGFGHEDPKSVF